MTDEEIYKQIAREMSYNMTDPAVWTRAFAESEGDNDKAKAIYIRLRHAALKENPPVSNAAPTTASLAVAVPVDDELLTMRRELAVRLAGVRRANCYGLLGLRATASDADVQAAAERAAAAERPDLRYAIETLTDPLAREGYDRRLLRELAAEDEVHDAQPTGAGAVTTIWASRKMSVIVGVASLVAIGYLALGFTREKTVQGAVGDSVAIQRETAESAAEIERRRVDNERMVAERAVALAERAASQREAAETRQRAYQEDRNFMAAQRAEADRLVRERREQSQLERSQRDQQRQEEMAAERKRRYWSCMNSSLDRASLANAEIRCAAYK